MALVDAVETFENPRQVSLRNADAGVGNAKHRSFIVGSRVNRDGTAPGVIFDGVVNQVVDNFADNLLHALNVRFRARNGNGYVLSRRGLLKKLCRFLRKL